MRPKNSALALAAATAVLLMPAPAARAAAPVPDVPAQYAGSLVLDQSGAQFLKDTAPQSFHGADCTGYQAGESVTTNSAGWLDLWTSGQTGSCAEVTTTSVWYTGVFEARMYIPSYNGKIPDWPAFWFTSRPEPWPTGGEIDVMEGLGGIDCSSYHYSATAGSADEQTASFCPWGTPSDTYIKLAPALVPGPGWHTFDLVWAPSFAMIYVDGQFYGQLSGSWFHPGSEALTIDNTSGPYGGQSTSSNLLVQYVRIWNYRYPQRIPGHFHLSGLGVAPLERR